MRLWVWFLAFLSGLRIRCCHELWCRLQTWLGSGIAVAVAVAGGYSSDLTPSLGISICQGWGPKQKKRKKKDQKLMGETAGYCDSSGNPWIVQFIIFFIFWVLLFLVFCRFFFRAIPTACGGSQARGLIRAIAASLHHSHSNAGSYTHRARPGIEPKTSWFLVGLISAAPWWELLNCTI